MLEKQPSGTRMIFAVISTLVGVLIPLALAEIVLRFLPVNGGLMAVAVNEKEPVFRFTPNRQTIWSRDWNFTIVNRIRVNNAGYVNDQDYDVADARPLCVVVGDSYVEASMVPYAETLHGRLAKRFAPQTRVYSLAASGAPFSQYLVWAREARERWRAIALAIVVIGNDWDESLATNKAGPGFHHYVEGPDGSLVLRRFDYVPSWWRELVRQSALGRYLFFNLQAPERLKLLLGTPGVLPASSLSGTLLRMPTSGAWIDRRRSPMPFSETSVPSPVGRPPTLFSWSMASAIRATTPSSWAATSSRCAPTS